MTRRRSVLAEVARGGGLLAAFLAVCVVAGGLFAGFFVPAAAGAGFLTRSGLDYYEELPENLEIPPLSERSTILAGDGSVIATLYSKNRVIVPLSDVNQTMRDAIVSIEDERFYEHNGVDAKGTLRALVNNQLNNSTQGASTLTQQYVKNVLVETAEQNGDEEAVAAATNSQQNLEGYQRKLREARYALAIEQQFSKDEILERYLNIANFGDGAYGIFMAAQHYFGITPAELTPPQAALLAGMVQSPTALDPVDNPEAAKSRRDLVLFKMLEQEKITQAEYDAAVASDLAVNVTPFVNGCDASGIMGFFCDYVQKEIIGAKYDADPAHPSPYLALGATEEERRNALFSGGLTIQTTINPAAQQLAWDAARSVIGETERAGVSLVSVEPRTGHILAMAQNRVFSRCSQSAYDSAVAEGRTPCANPGPQNTVLNFATDSETNGTTGFQPGSTFKPFTLARWLETGHSLGAIVPAAGPIDIYGREFSTCPGSEQNPGKYAKPIFNADDSEADAGGVPVVRATYKSINVSYINMAKQLNLCDIRDMANRFGVYDVAPTRGGPYGQFEVNPSMVLGGGNVTPLAMAGAYAAFAAEGLFCPPVGITAITDRSGAAVPITLPTCSQAVSPEVARGMTYALQQTIRQGTARRISGQIPFPAAGKTGTTNDAIATWMSGYTPHIATTVWIGDSSPTPESLKAFPIDNLQDDAGPTRNRNVYGSTFAAPTWANYMSQVVPGLGLPQDGFTDPPREMIVGPRDQVPNVIGRSTNSARAILQEAGFGMTISGSRASGTGVAEGLIGRQEPRGTAELGSSVTVFLSDGSRRQVAVTPVGGDGGGGGGGDGGGNGGGGDGNGRGGGRVLEGIIDALTPPGD